MGVITVPVSENHRKFINGLVKSGKAANKAHAVRMAIDHLAQEEALEMIRLGMQEVKEGKTLKGDLRKLASMID
jgi:Arc/MetJ-type ribon-helix-helix transcriptional regulator